MKLQISAVLSPVLALALGTLTACGGNATIGSSDGLCANSPVVGEWKLETDPTSTLTLTAQCVYQTQPCGTTGSFPPASAKAGTVLITVTAAGNGPTCLPLGTTACSYVLIENDATLGVDCGLGQIYYTQ